MYHSDHLPHKGQQTGHHLSSPPILPLWKILINHLSHLNNPTWDLPAHRTPTPKVFPWYSYKRDCGKCQQSLPERCHDTENSPARFLPATPYLLLIQVEMPVSFGPLVFEGCPMLTWFFDKLLETPNWALNREWFFLLEPLGASAILFGTAPWSTTLTWCTGCPQINGDYSVLIGSNDLKPKSGRPQTPIKILPTGMCHFVDCRKGLWTCLIFDSVQLPSQHC